MSEPAAEILSERALRESKDLVLYGGGGGIRTPETLSSLTVFKTAGFNRSPTPPKLSITCDTTYGDFW